MLCNFHKKSLEKIPDNHESHKIDFENYDYNPYEEDITPSFFDAFKRSSISNSPWESGSKWAKRSTISNSPWESGSKWAKSSGVIGITEFTGITASISRMKIKSRNHGKNFINIVDYSPISLSHIRNLPKIMLNWVKMLNKFSPRFARRYFWACITINPS